MSFFSWLRSPKLARQSRTQRPRGRFFRPHVEALEARWGPSTASLEWTRQFGTAVPDVAQGVAAGDTGVYVAGYTGGALPGQTSAGSEDAFVRLYDAAGNELWTRQFGTALTDVAQGVAADGG